MYVADGNAPRMLFLITEKMREVGEDLKTHLGSVYAFGKRREEEVARTFSLRHDQGPKGLS